MPWLAALLLLLAAFAAIGWLVARDRVLFRARFVDGRLVREHGRLPPGLRAELTEVALRAKWTGLVTAYRSEGRAAVRARGTADAAVVQRIRNVVGRFPLARIAAAPPRR